VSFDVRVRHALRSERERQYWLHYCPPPDSFAASTKAVEPPRIVRVDTQHSDMSVRISSKKLK